MAKNDLLKPEPGIYSTSLGNDELHEATTRYHPLKKQTNHHHLTVHSPTLYNYRARANSNIIERRFSNVEPLIQTPEQICKY